MDLKDVSEFIRQLEEAKFPPESIVLNKKTITVDDFPATIDIINPQTKYILYRFSCSPDTAKDPEDDDELEADQGDDDAQDMAENARNIAHDATGGTSQRHEKEPADKSRKRTAKRSQRLPLPMYSFWVRCSKPGNNRAPTSFILTVKVNASQAGGASETTKRKPDEFSILDLPPLYAVKNASEALFAKRRKEAAIEKVDTFALAMYIPAGALVVFTILNALGLFVLGDMQYAMLGAALLLFILPQTKSLKLLGIEFERYVPDEAAAPKADGGDSKDSKPVATVSDARSPMNKLVGTSPAIKKLFDDGLDPK